MILVRRFSRRYDKKMKKFWFSYFFATILFLSFSGLMFWIALPLILPTQKPPLSPLPSFLTIFSNNEATTIDIWEPLKKHVLGVFTKDLTITAKSALSYDLTSDKLLFSSNPDTRLPFASLTKIMTAIIALENPKKDDMYIVTNDALVGEDSMGLSAGEVLSLKELLYGLVLRSGNDAAEVLARNFSGGRQKFIEAMNDKAKALGLTNTHFTNPSGLEGDGNQYTTAYDLLVITKYALSHFSLFSDVVATVDYTIAQTTTHKEFDLENETNLLTSYPGVRGVKTGFTPEAGLCLVTYLVYNDHQIIGIILGSENRRDDMKEILDYSLKELGITPPPHA
jgi:D-alanyl-D-alanine carboxypeptidase (penicillin-binding protein 5/6)